MGRVQIREEEMEKIRLEGQMDESVMRETLKALRMKSIADVLEEVEVLIDTHFFNEFAETKSSMF